MEYIVVDLETTGLDAEKCHIIEIGAVKISDGAITDTFQTFVHIDYDLPFEITDLTGITDEDLIFAPQTDEAISQFEAFAGDCRTFIAHNASFEKSFLDKVLNIEVDWLDTIEIAHIVKPLLKYVRLNALLPVYGLKNEHAHRAQDDAVATAKLFRAMLADFESFDRDLLMKFLQLANGVESPLAALIQRICTEVLRKFPAKTIRGFDTDDSFLNFSGSILRNNPEANEDEINWNWQLPQEKITDFFNNLVSGGKGKKAFEARPQQVEMSKMVADAMSEHYALLVEAGTGTGKSLAYLLPAALYAKGSGMPVFISTNTINLQEQLIKKDIPLLKKQLQEQCGEDFSAVVVKGRSNYLCNRKWLSAVHSCTAETLPLYLRIAHWLSVTVSGDFSELNLFGRDWDRVQNFASSGETCGSYLCPHYKHRCYINNVRNQAKKANIIIINHSLLLATSMIGEGCNNILPPISNLIIDEAHQLETVAEKQFSCGITQKSFEKALHNLWQQEKLTNIVKYLQKIPDTEETVNLLTEVNDLMAECKDAAKDFFEISENIFVTNKKPYDKQLRIVTQRYDEDLWQPVENSLSNLILLTEKLCGLLGQIIAEFDSLDDPFFSVDLMGNFKITFANLKEFNATAQAIINDKTAGGEECVIWLEKRNPYEKVGWVVCPADIRIALNQYLYRDKLSLIMTSATLSSTDFKFFIDEIGLNQSEFTIKTHQLTSPFDYKRNCRIMLAADIPDYTKTSEIKVQSEIADCLYEIISASQGRALVLFTSYAQQRGVYNLLKPRLAKDGIRVLGHGISGGRDNILETHKNSEKSCILGVNSFWEGVDIQGEALSLLVIVRLPFNPPNTPTTEAKFERLSKEGKNPFSEYSLPQAIIRFKQGFGRLIRSKNDKGVVCVLDPRIWSKSYGKKFLNALPLAPVKRLTKEEMAKEIKEFLE